MANYYSSTYILEGKKETLKKIADAINNVNDYLQANKLYELSISRILIELGVITEKESDDAFEHNHGNAKGFGLMGSWNRPRFENINGQDVLIFSESYKWDACYDVERLAMLPQFKKDITGVYSRSFLELSDHFCTSDREGKYFPEEYSVFISLIDKNGEEQTLCGYYLLDDLIAELRDLGFDIPDDADINQIEHILHDGAEPDEDGHYDDDVKTGFDVILGAAGVTEHTVKDWESYQFGPGVSFLDF